MGTNWISLFGRRIMFIFGVHEGAFGLTLSLRLKPIKPPAKGTWWIDTGRMSPAKMSDFERLSELARAVKGAS